MWRGARVPRNSVFGTARKLRSAHVSGSELQVRALKGWGLPFRAECKRGTSNQGPEASSLAHRGAEVPEGTHCSEDVSIFYK